MKSLTPSRVWLLAWPLPILPVPMPINETWMPVLPSVTSSVGLLGRAFGCGQAGAAWTDIGSRGHHRGRGSGGLDHEVAPIQVACHDVDLQEARFRSTHSVMSRGVPVERRGAKVAHAGEAQQGRPTVRV